MKSMEKKKQVFNDRVRVRKSQKLWLKEHKDTKTIAGYLDKIINTHRKQHEANTKEVQEVLKEQKIPEQDSMPYLYKQRTKAKNKSSVRKEEGKAQDN